MSLKKGDAPSIDMRDSTLVKMNFLIFFNFSILLKEIRIFLSFICEENIVINYSHSKAPTSQAYMKPAINSIIKSTIPHKPSELKKLKETHQGKK